MKLQPTDAVIVDALRTPMARSKAGAFKYVRAENLSAHLMQQLLVRQPEVKAVETDDVIWGCVNQTLEQGFNIARMAALIAGLPATIPAQTVNRLCGSSMTALHSAVQAIQSGCGHQYLVGGVEHMGHVPMTHGIDINPALAHQTAKASMMMGVTAEMLAKMHQISREEQDRFALRSHQRAYAAQEQGLWQGEIAPIEAHNEEGFLCLLQQDEVIRSDANLAALGHLPPAFMPKHGSVTAGNASAMSDGASAMLLMSAAKADALSLKPRARVAGMAVAGCDPAVMGLGPVFAVQKLLQQTGLALNQIELLEINEAFAVQVLAVLQQLQLQDQYDAKVNLNGGAIALGHPLGCSGTRICTTLLNLMEAKDATLGVATLCVGMGQGVATLIERI
ncbi:acetyl-CoA C-acyltransferase FadA [Pontibacter sp. JAM-7]|uniref:acetyl-CoA C-acyltransferase FadA n=1 Tax=Pontibacter sp. JAM-7 TaxID=3366581 RepID=UPI003AF69D89